MQFPTPEQVNKKIKFQGSKVEMHSAVNGEIRRFDPSPWSMKDIIFDVSITKKVNSKSLKNTLDFVTNYFKNLGLLIKFNCSDTDFDESDKKNYKIDYMLSFKEWKLTKSIDSNIIRNLGPMMGIGRILFVDKQKALEESTLRGKADWNNNYGAIEVYSRPNKYVKKRTTQGKTYYDVTSRKINSEYRHDEYVLIHEIIHILSKKFTADDKLHDMILEDKFESYVKHITKITVEKLSESTRPPWAQEMVHLEGFGLQPVVERKLQDVMYEMAIDGYPMIVVEGKRSCAKQNELYNRVPKVTNAKCGYSFHQYGVAVDCIFIVYGYNAPEWLWQKYGNIAKKYGFEWGGDWTSFPDRPHIQLTFEYDINDFKNQLVDYSRYL